MSNAGMTGEELAVALGGRKNGKGWIASCPAHPDKHPSLDIIEKNGQVLFVCRARCSQEAVIAALRERGFWSEPKAERSRQQRARPKIVATYDYRDEKGELLFQVCRFEPGRDGTKKDFRQRRRKRREDDPEKLRLAGIKFDDEWVWSVEGVRCVPYRLHELIATPHEKWVFVVEGEKDAERLVALRLAATTNSGGAGKWRSEYAAYFRDRRVAIIPDNDEVGRKHARDVARSLLGVAREVRIADLPGLSEKGDVSDWFDALGTVEALLALVEDAKPLLREDLEREDVDEPEAKRETQVALAFTRVGHLLAEPDEKIEWVVDGLLSESGLSAMVSKPKVGKSTLARCIALAVARGEMVLGRASAKGPVLYLGLEESKRQVKAHFRALGATDADDVHVFAGAAPVGVLLELRAAVTEYHPALVIVDTLFRLTRVKDANAYAEVTAALDPLLALARELRAHVMVLHHSPKGDARQAVEAALGSIAITGSVDIVMALRKNDRFRTIISEQREGDGFPEEVTLDFDEETRRVTLGPTRKAVDSDEVAGAILEWLAGQAEPVKEEPIHEAVEGRRNVKVKALRSLVDGGKVLRTGAGKKGDPYFYQAAPESPEESSFPGSHHMSGTRKPESSNGTEPRAKSGEKVVPASSPSSEEFRNQKAVAEDDGKWGEP